MFISFLPLLYRMPKKIILADDSSMQRGTYRSAIKVRVRNIEIDEVENGKQLVDRVRGNKYSLIITDYQMPEVDGLEATRQIREFDKVTPICIASSINLEEQASKLGARYVSKDRFGENIEPILNEYLQ